MNSWISRFTGYLNKFLEVGVLLLAVSVLAEIIFGPNVPFFGSQVTENLPEANSSDNLDNLRPLHIYLMHNNS